MGIDTERDIEANLQIGPTDKGMVRLFLEAEGGIEIPRDFTTDEAVEIAEEVMAAAHRAGEAGKNKRSGTLPGRHLISWAYIFHLIGQLTGL